jgi:beta-1,4-mannosyltransferase
MAVAAPVFRVLESFPTPSAQTNPYIIQLRDSLASTPGVEVRCWSWKTALLGRYDVFHTHWSEALIERRGRASTIARRILFFLFLVRLSVTGTPIVRTMHNLELPSGLSRVEVYLLKRVDRLTRVRIVLNTFTPVPPGTTSVLIEHGHYRDWFAKYPQPPTVPGRFVFVGKVRRYKNVEGLVRAFIELPKDGEPFSLHVAGKPSSVDLANTLEGFAESDPRLTLLLGFVEDDVLAREVGEAELVVLPYHEMHNSGSVLAALSMDRPVLVPDNEFNRALAREVGHGWVITFAGDLTGDSIVEASKAVRSADRDSRPDLSAREWSDAGERHLAAFRAARAQTRPAPESTSPAVRSE